MDTSADKRMTGFIRMRFIGMPFIVALLCLSLCMIWVDMPKGRQVDVGHDMVGDKCGFVILDDLDAEAVDVYAGLDPVVQEAELSDQDRTKLFVSISNIVVAYSNNDARALHEGSKSALDFLDDKRRHISAEICASAMQPVKQVLVDHFLVNRRCGVSKAPEELDAHMSLDMELLMFAFETSLKWDLHIIDDRFEGVVLAAIGMAQCSYERESRDDMVEVCDKWALKWREQIDSSHGYGRIKFKRSYLRGLRGLESQFRNPDYLGAFITREDFQKDCYDAAKEFGRVYGYTPKWVSKYSPQGR